MYECTCDDDPNTRRFTKDPGEKLDYRIDWSDAAEEDDDAKPWLGEGEIIATSTWDVPPGLTMSDDTKDDTSTTVWLAGGTLRARYEAVNVVTTNQGRIGVRRIFITIDKK